MNFVSLLGSELKSDSIIELLELWESEVVYDFDRLHENTPDKYWVSAESEGVQFRFDENQILVRIFLYVLDWEGFSSIDLNATDVPAMKSPGEAFSYANQYAVGVSNGEGELFGVVREWVRLEWNEYSIHYEFREGVLSLVTLSSVQDCK